MIDADSLRWLREARSKAQEAKLEIESLKERVVALETFIVKFSEALDDDPEGDGEQRRWREAHLAARARRARERRP